VATFGWLNFKCFSADTCNIPGSPKPCQVTTARCAPTPHPSPSIHTGWVVASGDRTPNLTFNTSGSPADATSCAFFVTSLARPDHVRLLQPDAPQPLYPSPSIHIGWVVASGDRTPNLTFNTSGSPADATSRGIKVGFQWPFKTGGV